MFAIVAADANRPQWVRDRARRLGEAAHLTLAAAKSLGVPIAMGADAGPQGTNAQEILRLADAGLTPAETIVASTANAARACGLDSLIGTIEKGKLADLSVFDGDPLADIAMLADTARFLLVFQAGRLSSGQLITDRGANEAEGRVRFHG